MTRFQSYGRRILVVTVLAVLTIAFSLIESSAQAFTYDRVLRVSDRAVISFNEMIDDLASVHAVFVGEHHNNGRHHDAQLDVIAALHERRVPVAVGLEMIARKSQHELDLWSSGSMDESGMRRLYRQYWNFPWSLYRGIFLYAQDNGLGMVGLNVPASVTRTVSRKGIDGLAPDEQDVLAPDVTCEDIDSRYREFISNAYSSHSRRDFEYFCQAQKIWDKTMAWYLMDYLDLYTGSTVVVVAGLGHTWKQGMPAYVRDFSRYAYRTVLPEIPGRLTAETVTADYADYLLLE